MADYNITTQDVEEAAQLLRDVLTTRNPDNDYSQGSVLGDTIVDGHATVFALLRKQLSEIKNRLSLRDISKLNDSESVRDAADAILSNFYRERDQGRFARGSVTLHFTQHLVRIGAEFEHVRQHHQIQTLRCKRPLGIIVYQHNSSLLCFVRDFVLTFPIIRKNTIRYPAIGHSICSQSSHLRHAQL